MQAPILFAGKKSKSSIWARIGMDPALIQVGFKLFVYLYLLSGREVLLLRFQQFGSFIYQVYAMCSTICRQKGWSAKTSANSQSSYVIAKYILAKLSEPRATGQPTSQSCCPEPLVAPIASRYPEGCKRVNQVGQCDLQKVFDNYLIEHSSANAAHKNKAN